ncbi:IS3 family transposase [Streptomyces halobius]|uniref:IS3 family transposase n=1 Tax=Streptomyces halobius TaxID=2879846 RepID=A0ABY4MML0_9ACTN|nr:IS3 family transposase [Streptomyces halobius]
MPPASCKAGTVERRGREGELTEKIRRIHADPSGIYGSPRVHAVLHHEDVAVDRKRVERLMREAELAGVSPAAKASPGATRRPPRMQAVVQS